MEFVRNSVGNNTVNPVSEALNVSEREIAPRLRLGL